MRLNFLPLFLVMVSVGYGQDRQTFARLRQKASGTLRRAKRRHWSRWNCCAFWRDSRPQP